MRGDLLKLLKIHRNGRQPMSSQKCNGRVRPNIPSEEEVEEG